MSVTQSSVPTSIFARVFAVALVASALAAHATFAAEGMSSAQQWGTPRPNAASRQLPLARLIRNPDQSGVAPAYALADQSGRIQRYVEAVPTIDLEPYVGYAVKVRHDTGRTLLASQLELPGHESEGPMHDEAAISSASPTMNALFQGIVNGPGTLSGVQPAQFVPVQYAPQAGTPVMMQDGTMMQPQGAMMQPQGPMMQPQGMVTYDPMNPAMGGMPMGAYPPGAAPIYLDGMSGCGPQGCGPQGCPMPYAPCPQPQMYMQPVAACPPPAPVCPPPPPAAKWSIWGEALWIHPTGIDMAHAQQQNGIGGAGTVPFGDIGVADFDYDIGFRIGGEVRYAPKESIYVQYTWFETDAMSSLVAPDIPGGGGAVGSLVHHPGTALTASAGPLDANYDIKFQVGEAAWRHFVSCTSTSEVTVLVGARYGKLDQSFTQTGIFGGGLGGAVNTSTTIDFDGGGPIAGITGEHLIGTSRFTVYGRAVAGALTGQFQSRYTMFNQSTSTLLAQSNWTDDRIVPMLDYEVGVAWIGPQGHLRVALGYMATYWFNAVTTPVWVDAVQADNYVNVSDTIAFDGAVGRVEVRW